MNQVNFNPIDYGNMMRRDRENWNDVMNGLNSLGETWKEANERKHKWDSVMAMEKEGQDALDAEQKYNESVGEYNRIQGYIDTNNAYNERLRREKVENDAMLDEWNRLYEKQQNGYEGVENNSGLSGEIVDSQYGPLYRTTDANGKESDYSIEGIKNGEYGGSGLSWRNGLTEQEQARMDELNGKMNPNRQYDFVDNGGLEWKRDDLFKKGLDYQKAGANAAMYRDPRYKAALETAKANNDPSAIYAYMNQWHGEEPYRRQQESLSSLDKIDFGDLSQYGPMASIAKQYFDNANTYEGKVAALNMLNGAISLQEQSRQSKAERDAERERANNIARAVDEFNSKDWSKAYLYQRAARDLELVNENPKYRKAFMKMYGIKNGDINGFVERLKPYYDQWLKASRALKESYGYADVNGQIRQNNSDKMYEDYLRAVQYGNNTGGNTGSLGKYSPN